MGKIDRLALKHDEENFKLVYDNFVLAELSFKEMNKDVVKLNDRVREIEQVIVAKQSLLNIF